MHNIQFFPLDVCNIFFCYFYNMGRHTAVSLTLINNASNYAVNVSAIKLIVFPISGFHWMYIASYSSSPLNLNKALIYIQRKVSLQRVSCITSLTITWLEMENGFPLTLPANTLSNASRTMHYGQTSVLLLK